MLTWIRRTVIVLVLLVAGRGAHAQNLQVIEPADGFLNLGPVNIGTTSQPKRISLRNPDSTSPRLERVFIRGNGVFSIVASGGDLAPGHTEYWDIVASPTDLTQPDVCDGEFVFSYLTSNDTDVSLSIFVGCDARNVPLDADAIDFGPYRIPPSSIVTRRVPVVNTSAVPLEIAAITSSDPAFDLTLRSGSFPLTLAPEGSVELDLRFMPTAPSIGYETSIVATLTDGTSYAITHANGDSDDNFVFFMSYIVENTPVGQPWRRYGALANYPTQPLVVTGIEITHPDVAVLGIAVGDTVPGHTVLPLLVQVTPAAPGAISADITLHFDTAPSLTAHVEAFGAITPLAFTTEDAAPDDGQLDFGTLSPSSPPVTRTITIANQGAAGAFIECLDANPGQGFTFAGCGMTLAAGASIDVAVTFTPGSPAPIPFFTNRRTGGFRLIQNHQDSYIVELTAMTPSYPVALSTDRLTFADTVRSPATAAALDVTLMNLGVTPMPVPAATVAGAGFHLGSPPPSGTIAPLASVTYRVEFEPLAVGAFDGVLSLDGSGDITLHGNGVLRPVSSEPALDFGEVKIGARLRRSIAVHNAGATPISVGALTVDDARFAAIAPAQPTIAAGGDLAIEVEYAPAESAMHTGTLAIAFDGDATPQLLVALRGTGIPDAGTGIPDAGTGVDAGTGTDAGTGVGTGTDGGAGTDPDPDTGCSTGRGHGSPILALGVLALLVRRRHR